MRNLGLQQRLQLRDFRVLFEFSAPGGENSPYLSITTDAGGAVPEPATFALMGLGGAVLLFARRRTRR
ncbi:MAG: PEP-CTERM sorting domain-containing protein [bacterium]